MRRPFVFVRVFLVYRTLFRMRKIITIIICGFAIIGFALVGGFFAVKFGLTKTAGIIDNQREGFFAKAKNPAWARGDEWETFTAAVRKDAPDINRAASLSGVSARLIVAQLIGEQLRLFYTNRELFKTVFAPLKLFGNQSQFSWGVMGLKQETARAVEAHLKDMTSPYYLGKTYENLLDFKTADRDSERFARVVDEKSRFYSYLYTGLYLKQIMKQWKTAGYDISSRPEILSTLFNIGFEHSEPKAGPQVGGSAIEIGGETYSFGGLAAEFYYSEELISEVPKE